jgi:hypothetical protein
MGPKSVGDISKQNMQFNFFQIFLNLDQTSHLLTVRNESLSQIVHHDFGCTL